MPKQSPLAEGIASLRFTPLAMTSHKNWFLERTQILYLSKPSQGLMALNQQGNKSN